MGGGPNIWSGEWEVESSEEWSADRWTRLARGQKIGATLYELRPGTKSGSYHFHHGPKSSSSCSAVRRRCATRPASASSPQAT